MLAFREVEKQEVEKIPIDEVSGSELCQANGCSELLPSSLGPAVR
jgi:hypothetical protein